MTYFNILIFTCCSYISISTDVKDEVVGRLFRMAAGIWLPRDDCTVAMRRDDICCKET